MSTYRNAYHVQQLQIYGACDGARAFAARYPTMRKAYANCRHPSWYAWLLLRIDSQSINDINFRAEACKLVRTSLMGKLNKQFQGYLAKAEAFTNGQLSQERRGTAFMACLPRDNAQYAVERLLLFDFGAMDYLSVCANIAKVLNLKPKDAFTPFHKLVPYDHFAHLFDPPKADRPAPKRDAKGRFVSTK
jgi:hypothetical protein